MKAIGIIFLRFFRDDGKALASHLSDDHCDRRGSNNIMVFLECLKLLQVPAIPADWCDLCLYNEKQGLKPGLDWEKVIHLRHSSCLNNVFSSIKLSACKDLSGFQNLTGGFLLSKGFASQWHAFSAV